MPEFANGGRILGGLIGLLPEPGCPGYVVPAAAARHCGGPTLADVNASPEDAPSEYADLPARPDRSRPWVVYREEC